MKCSPCWFRAFWGGEWTDGWWWKATSTPPPPSEVGTLTLRIHDSQLTSSFIICLPAELQTFTCVSLINNLSTSNLAGKLRYLPHLCSCCQSCTHLNSSVRFLSGVVLLSSSYTAVEAAPWTCTPFILSIKSPGLSPAVCAALERRI